MASVVDGDMDAIGFEIKELNRDGNDRGVDFDDVDVGAAAGKFHGDDADAHADAEHVVDVGGVSPGEAGKHEGERGTALFANGVVGVLGQVIIGIQSERAVGTIEYLDFTKVRVPVET